MDSLIYDRTDFDVSEAKKIISEKIKKFIETTEEENTILRRGTITLETIDRIINKQIELSNLFYSSFYLGNAIEKMNFTEIGIFKETDFDKMIENGETLRNRFFDYKSTPSRAVPKYDYQNINAIERLLYDLNRNYNYMMASQKECDEFYCGEE